MTRRKKISDQELKKQCIHAIFCAWFVDKDIAIKFIKDLEKDKNEDFIENHPTLLFILGYSIYNKKKLILNILLYVLCIVFFVWMMIWMWDAFWFLVNEVSEIL